MCLGCVILQVALKNMLTSYFWTLDFQYLSVC